MPKVKRQMPAKSGQVCLAQGEAVRDPISDETYGPPHEHRDTGSAKSKVGTGTTTTVMTSNSRTARCGLACRLVWQECLLKWRPPMPIGT